MVSVPGDIHRHERGTGCPGGTDELSWLKRAEGRALAGSVGSRRRRLTSLLAGCPGGDGQKGGGPRGDFVWKTAIWGMGGREKRREGGSEMNGQMGRWADGVR